MGTFATTVRVGNPDGGDTLEVEALVDTGASHSMFPASLLDALHISRRSQVDGTLADGSEVSYWRGRALIGIDGREVSYWRGRALIGIDGREDICPALFGPEGEDASVIGATTLQILMFKVDPTREVLEPTDRVRV